MLRGSLVAVLLAAPLARAGLEQDIHEKRLAQISDLRTIRGLMTPDDPALLFRLGELWFEEARYFLLQNDAAQRDAAAQRAIETLSGLVQEFPRWSRNDEVLYSLGQGLLDTGDEPRALVAFRRLVDRYPASPIARDAWFRLGEHFFTRSQGRRDWLERALEAYVQAAADPASTLHADAISRQGWCLLNLGDFDGALAHFREVAKLGGGRAKDARNDFVLAWVRSGAKPGAARAALGELTGSADERRALEQRLAERYFAGGFDREAAAVWQALIQERPRAPEAVAFQVSTIDAVMRAGNKQVTVGHVRRLVELAGQVPGADLGAAEPLLARLATAWHQECRKTHEDRCLAYPSAVYEAYLALFPATPRAYELHFYWGELLFETAEFARAATQYRAVVDRDVGCRESRACEPGRFLEAAAFGEVKAREALADRETSQHGQRPREGARMLAAR